LHNEGPGTTPPVTELVWYRWFQDTGGVSALESGQCLGRRLSIFLVKYATIFQAEIYAILACADESQMNTRSEKYVCICFDSQVALKALQAAKRH
jgi:hypothetical protein